jgi:glutamate-1-semialdehyde 2,1-aminomutase
MCSESVELDYEESLISSYEKKTKLSRAIWEKATRYFPSGITRDSIFYSPYPSYAKKAQGSKIIDIDGNSRIDFCFNFTSLILGHKPPTVIREIQSQLEAGLVYGAPTEFEAELAEEIVRRVPSVRKLRFTVTGTEANMYSMRVARAFTNKKKIAKFEGGYHGTSDYAMVSVHPRIDSSAESTSISDTLGLSREVTENVVSLPFNDLDSTEKIVRTNREDIAAIITEPIMRGIEPSKGFLKGLRELCDSLDILLIFDEVITGFRLAPGGAQEKYGVIPDITAMGKVIGGGFPVGAFGASEEIMSLMDFQTNSFPTVVGPVMPQSGTFNAHPIGLVAGLATLKELTAEKYEHIDRMATQMRDYMKQILDEEKIQAQVYGPSSLFHLVFTESEVVDYRSSYIADAILLSYLDLELIDQGIYFAPRHFSCTSTATSTEDVEKARDKIRISLRKMKPLIRERNPKLVRF